MKVTRDELETVGTQEYLDSCKHSLVSEDGKEFERQVWTKELGRIGWSDVDQCAQHAPLGVICRRETRQPITDKKESACMLRFGSCLL